MSSGPDVVALLDLLDRPAWMTAARCREPAHRELFQRLAARSGRVGDAGPACEVCRSCPVRADCEAWALARLRRSGLTHLEGVFGGFKVDELRRRVREEAGGLDLPLPPALVDLGQAEGPVAEREAAPGR